MKKLFALLLLFPMLASASFVATDGDVDFSLQGTLTDPTAFFAFVTPDGINDVTGELTGGAIAVPANLEPLSGHIATSDFPTPFAAGGGVDFDIGIWYDTEWSNPTDVQFTGGDTWLFTWAPNDWGNQTASLLMSDIAPTAAAVPVPAAVWLFGSGLFGMLGIGRVNPG